MPDIIFMGTPEFAVPALKALIDAGYHIPLVVSQPDRKKGRGQKVRFTPTKITALEYGIEVFQPESIRSQEAIAKLAGVTADFFVVIAYGKILPESILNLPKKACINVHASLLPRWRGAAPIQFSLLKGDRQTGVCTMLMDKGMDTGDLLLVGKTDIDPHETAGELSDRLSKLGGELIVETLARFDQLSPVSQNHDQATYTRLLTKEDRFIHWHSAAQEVYCQFRALSPFPGVVTTFRGKRLMIKKMELPEDTRESPGQKAGVISALREDSFDIACNPGVIRITSCQPESRKEVNAGEFINGYQVKIGEQIGDRA